MFALVWSVGSTGVEAGQRAFLEFLENVVADLGVIQAEWEGVNNALQVRILIFFIDEDTFPWPAILWGTLACTHYSRCSPEFNIQRKNASRILLCRMYLMATKRRGSSKQLFLPLPAVPPGCRAIHTGVIIWVSSS